LCTTPKGSLRIAAWLLLSAIAAFSLISPDYRVTTFVPHDIEHFVIFALVGLTFGLAYPSRYIAHTVALLAFTAAIELAQLWAPGRHARFSDFTVNALGLAAGLGLTYLLARRNKTAATPVASRRRP
jgi:VanZ family protein